MKIVKVYGGLGNQMFQYAFARALEAASADEFLFDCSAADSDPTHNGFELKRVFGLDLKQAAAKDSARLSVPPTSLVNRLRRKYLTKKSHLIDRKFGYQPEVLTLRGDICYEGYWQSEKYFKGLEGDIRKTFEFVQALSQENERTLQELPRPVASIHVRRGDYLKYANLDICTPSYYRHAIEALGPRIASVLVFSDDIDYCKQTLALGGVPAVYVDRNRGADSWQDMAMMSRCDHHIIANSSFSWWGAWLDGTPGSRVIAPAIWNRREIRDNDHYYSFTFSDVVPEGWERVAI